MKIETERLILRPWIEADREPFAEMSFDLAVMEHLLPLKDRKATDLWIDRQTAHQREHGFCFWALEVKEFGVFAGAVGLIRIGYDAPFTPAVEVGWRLSRRFWGRGYAPEAAAASIRFGFEALQLAEVVAYTVAQNKNSQRVMKKLGMTHNPSDDFDLPGVPDGHPLRHQLLHRLPEDRWSAAILS